MDRQRLLVASAVLAVVVVRFDPPSARAEGAGESALSGPPVAVVATTDDASMLPVGIVRILDALAMVGLAEVDKTSAMMSRSGVLDTPWLPVRVPSWVSPEPPRTPLFYSRVLQLTF